MQLLAESCRARAINDVLARDAIHAGFPFLLSDLSPDGAEGQILLECFSQLVSEQVDAMRCAHAEGALAALAEIADSLRGTVETFGFDAFEAPVRRLVKLAADGQRDGIEEVLDELTELGARVMPPLVEAVARPAEHGPEGPSPPTQNGGPDPAGPAEVDSPLVTTLPTDDPEFCEIVVGWVQRLREQLAAMQAAAGHRDTTEVARLAHWLKGSVETMEFGAFTAPARELERLAKEQWHGQIEDAITALCGLADRIVVPETATVGTGSTP